MSPPSTIDHMIADREQRLDRLALHRAETLARLIGFVLGSVGRRRRG
jgi:hypothetical protein